MILFYSTSDMYGAAYACKSIGMYEIILDSAIDPSGDVYFRWQWFFRC